MSARVHDVTSTLALGLWLSSLSACPAPKHEPHAPEVAVKAVADAPDQPAPAIAVPTEKPVPSAGRELAIAAGSLRAGSPTGSADRNPAREADDVALAIPAFSIDALPYPNDPAQPPKTAVSRSEAAALCRAQDKRLCSELEWERACKGDENVAYPVLGSFDAASCARELGACATPFGVFAMGTSAREWTSSPTTRGLGDSLRKAVVRGAPKDAAAKLHRCAARDAATPDSKSESLTFRCCRGAELTVGYPSEPERAPFTERALNPDELRTLLSAMAETRDVAASFRAFSADEVTKALAKAGHSRAGMAPWTPVQKPLLWSPVHGEQLGVLVGDTARGAMLVAYYPLESGRYLFAGSYETKGEHTAMVLGYKLDSPGELLFSTCWGCGGEGGALSLAEDARLHIVQR